MGSWFKITLWKRVMLGLGLGIIVGLVMRYSLGMEAAGQFSEIWLKPVGDAFVRLIRMLIVPLILCTLISGVVSLGDPRQLGRIGARAFGLYCLSTLIAVLLGLTAGSFLQPGNGISLPSPSRTMEAEVSSRLDIAASAEKSVKDRLLEVIPTNPIQALATTDILGVIFFSILVGVGILLIKKEGDILASFFDSAAKLMIRLTELLMELSPIGVGTLIAWVFASQDFSLLFGFLGLTLTLYAVCLLQIFVVYPILLKLIANQDPLQFFRGMANSMAIAYSTASSSATLPVTIECLVKNLKLKRSNATGVASIGSTINMDGAAIYLSLVCCFALQANGIELDLQTLMTIGLLGTLGSIGAAGIPNGGLFMSAAVLGGLGLTPAEVVLFVALLFPFDRILDMMRTLTNVTGDAAVATIVDRSLNSGD